jgi:hypothetical protein
MNMVMALSITPPLLALGVRSPSDPSARCRNGELGWAAAPERVNFGDDPNTIGEEEGTFLAEGCPRGVVL